ncbi:hypothetical protein EX30DRAFT_374746 [Ascodesmis nigricans]|uniref:Uncharacterized protein n=1 Tax=Ascodesmis nigricans TaxID=341454 RepID=A0A4S2MKE2_9PEZI|nr:hypothetical protein EX30DRAFT_374746 [Ascodesmis nigricans]
MVGVSWCAVEGIVAYYKLRPIAPPWPHHPSSYRSETSNTSDSPTLITAPISQASLSAHSSAHSSPGHRPRPKLGKYIRAREISRTASFFGSFYRPSASPPSQNRSNASTRDGHSDAESGRQSRGRARDDDEYSRDADSEREDTGDESDDSDTTQQALLSSSLPFDDPPLLPSTLSRSKTAPSTVPRIITTPSTPTTIRTYGTLEPPAPEISTFRSGSPTSYHAHITFSHSPLHHPADSSPPDSPLISVHEFDFPSLPDSTPSPTYPSFPSYTTSFTPHHFPAPSPPPSLLPPTLHPRDPRRVFGVAINKLPVWMAAMWRLGSLLRHTGHAILYAGVLGAGWRWGVGGWWVVGVLGGMAAARGANTVVWYTGQAKRRGMAWSSGWLVGTAVVQWVVAGWGWGWY